MAENKALVIDVNKGKEIACSDANIFSSAGRTAPSSETVFALYWKLGDYGEGSMYQAQMGSEEVWSPGSGWGSGKGISYTLYNSFDKNDPRLYELCLVVDHEYTTATGQKVYYGPNHGSYDIKQDHVKTGTDFLNTGQCVLNNVKKFIWGVDGTATQEKGMSIDRRTDIIRLSDVYMMRAEAKMALEDMSVTAKSSAGLDDINAVLRAHGAPLIKSAIAYFDDMSQPATSYTFNVKVDEGAPVAISVKEDKPMYHNLIREDFVQQRRKEFAMEGQAWLDLKRFFYRDPESAKMFMEQMDRGIQFSQNPEIQDESLFETESGYSRRQLVYDLNAIVMKKYPDNGYNTGEKEPEVFVQSFIDHKYWFLPIPTSAKAYLAPGVQDLTSQVLDQTYPY